LGVNPERIGSRRRTRRRREAEKNTTSGCNTSYSENTTSMGDLIDRPPRSRAYVRRTGPDVIRDDLVQRQRRQDREHLAVADFVHLELRSYCIAGRWANAQ
jgi:hypothetical protein